MPLITSLEQCLSRVPFSNKCMSISQRLQRWSSINCDQAALKSAMLQHDPKPNHDMAKVQKKTLGELQMTWAAT